jgi:small subunit ribosomal protein S20
LPNIKSAIKRVKVNEKKNLRNRIVKTKVKTAIKKFDAELANNPANAGAQYSVTTSAIDKAASKGIIHKNTANRKKSRLAKQMAKTAQAQ